MDVESRDRLEPTFLERCIISQSTRIDVDAAENFEIYYIFVLLIPLARCTGVGEQSRATTKGLGLCTAERYSQAVWDYTGFGPKLPIRKVSTVPYRH